MAFGIKLLHVINSLNQGGAEIMLADLLKQADDKQFQHEIISLTTLGPIAKRIQDLGMPVYAINLHILNFPWALVKLVYLVWRFNPDVVQTWMYHSNLFGGIAAKLASRAKIIWGLHASRLDVLNTKIGTLLVIRLCSKVANWLPDRIICCSESAQKYHESLGYSPEIISFIPNGFDLHKFHASPDAKANFIKELGLDNDTFIVGLIARYHPNKDHRNLFVAANLLLERIPNVHFVCCGKDVTDNNSELTHALKEFNVYDHFSLLGERRDIAFINAAIDLAVSASFIGEAFPLVLGEAMACGTPCVSTNVGDADNIVGDTGRIVSPRDPEALAGAIGDILTMQAKDRQELGQRAQKRIINNFSIDRISGQYFSEYLALINDKT